MESITQYIEQRLKLRVNRQKSVVALAVERSLLGFQFFRYRDGRVGVAVAPKALKRAEDRIRQLTTRNWGVSMERRVKEINRFTVGWTAYFALSGRTSAPDPTLTYNAMRPRHKRARGLARYTISAGERVTYGQRVPCVVRFLAGRPVLLAGVVALQRGPQVSSS
jgi:hypothetical protein